MAESGSSYEENGAVGGAPLKPPSDASADQTSRSTDNNNEGSRPKTPPLPTDCRPPNASSRSSTASGFNAQDEVDGAPPAHVDPPLTESQGSQVDPVATPGDDESSYEAARPGGVGTDNDVFHQGSSSSSSASAVSQNESNSELQVADTNDESADAPSTFVSVSSREDVGETASEAATRSSSSSTQESDEAPA